MVETSSYGARSLVTPATCTLSPPGRRDTVPPRVSRSLVIVRTSARSGALPSVTGAAVRSAAAIAGRVAFLAALTFTVPRSGTPPSISSRAGITPSPRRTGPRPRGRRGRPRSRSRPPGRAPRRRRLGRRPRIRERAARPGGARGARTRDRARARAQVEGAQSDAVLRGRQEPEGPFDQRLGLGPRDEDVRRYVDPQPPERLPAEDLLQGLTARAPPDSRRVARGDR